MTKKTGPLLEAALVNFAPTPKDIVNELRSQNAAINDIAITAQELRDAVKLQNGRVTSLEKTVAPINSAYGRFKTLFTVVLCFSPILASLMTAILGKVIDHFLK